MRSTDGWFDAPCCHVVWGIVREGWRLEWMCICEYRLELFREAGLVEDPKPERVDVDTVQGVLDFGASSSSPEPVDGALGFSR